MAVIGSRNASLELLSMGGTSHQRGASKTHFQTLAAASALPTFGRSFSLSTERCCLLVW